jgi:Glycosyl hydrolase catalytic core
LTLARDSCASNPRTYTSPTNGFIESGPPDTNGNSMGKRGLSYNNASLTYLFSNDSAVTWAYDWASFPNGSLPTNLEFIPTLWGLNEDVTSSWFAQASSAIASGSRHLFSFNEPDIETQANIAPDRAAAGFIEYMNPFSDQVKLGAPAVTNGLGSLGLSWLSSFFDACAGRCVVDFVNIHWYGSADGVSDFQLYLSNASALAAENGVKTLWITELRGNGEIDRQLQFLNSVLPWLDEQGNVARYAWFMCATSDGNLISDDGTESALGQIYF